LRTALAWGCSRGIGKLLLLPVLSVVSGLGQVRDQEFDAEISSAPGSVALGVGDQSDKAMTFTVGRSGALHSIEIHVARVEAITQPFLVDVHRTSGLLLSKGDRSVLGSTSVPATTNLLG
jgi:hypothetical protein